MDGQPWSVRGVEPDIRADAFEAARKSGLTLGQWLNGVIRDSLVDLKATRGASGWSDPVRTLQESTAMYPAPGQGPVPMPFQPEAARATMHNYPGQQPAYPYAPMPPGYAPPAPPAPPQVLYPAAMPYAPPPPPYVAGYPGAYQPAPYPAPFAGSYPQPAPMPFEPQMRQAGRPGQDGPSGTEQRLLTAIDALTHLIEKAQVPPPPSPAAAVAPARAPEPAERPLQPQVQSAPRAKAPPSEVEQTNKTLAALVDRLAQLEKALVESESKRTSAPERPAAQSAPADRGAAVRQIEDKIGAALDSLTRERSETPPAPPSQPIPVRPPVRPAAAAAPARPRPPVTGGASRGALAIAEIAARQRALDVEERAQPMAGTEASALEAIRRSIAALADQVKEQRAEVAQPQSDFDLRAELRHLQNSLRDLAPRESIAAVGQSIQALAHKIEQSRQEGVRESQLAPIEKLLADMRLAMESLREPPALGALADTLEHLARKVEDIGARSIDPRQIAELQREFAGVRASLSEAQHHQPVNDLQTQIGLLGRKLDALIESPRDGKVVALVTEAVEDIRQNMRRFNPDQLMARIDQRMQALELMDARLSDLAQRIDSQRNSGPDQHGIDQIARQIAHMTQSLSQRPAAPAPDLGPVLERIDNLGRMLQSETQRTDPGFAERLEAMHADLAARVSMADTGPIERRLDELHADLAARTSMADTGPLQRRLDELQAVLQQRAPQPDMKGLEQILRKLADRIESVREPNPSKATLDALQHQIVALAERIESGGPGSSTPALDGLERTLSDLVQRVSSIKDMTANAAEKAVREAIGSQPAGGGMDPLAAEGMLLIKRDLTEMKSAQSSAEARSRETLQLVNATLEQIVSRLGILEGEIARPRPVMAAQAAAAPAAAEPTPLPVPTAALAGNHDRVSPPLARPVPVEPPPAPATAPQAAPPTMRAPVAPVAADEPDLPIEPGGGRQGAPIAASAPEAAPGADPRASFIAAARRAAQAASAQTAAVLSEIEEAKGPLRKLPTGGETLAGVKSIIGQRRKPLLLGLAALVFAVGGLKVATNLMGGEEPVTTGSISKEETKPAALPEAKPANNPLDKRMAAAESKLSEPGKPLDLVKIPNSDNPQLMERIEKRQDVAEEALTRTLPKMALGKAADPMPVGSIGIGQPSSAQPSPPAALPGAPAARPDEPAADPAALARLAPFSGPERLRQAAAEGNLSAIYEIGSRMAEGRGVPRDFKGAARWLEYAAGQGFAPAQYRIGSFNREGIGMAKDAKKAFVWFQRAAEQGQILAMHNLAVLHAEGVNGQPDYGAAANWFRNAAEHGVKDSQFNIAILYVRGLGVTQDMVEAYKWFAAAAAQGDNDAGKKRDEVAARLQPDQLAKAKEAAETFRAKRPDPRSNDVVAPEGGWDAAGKAAAAPKKTRV